MASSAQAAFLELFREFAALEKRRTGSGVTPLEFNRWSDLKKRLGHRFQQRGAPKKAQPSRLRIEFETAKDFVAAQLAGLTSGQGLFIQTPFAVSVGRSFVARVRIRATREEIELPCSVVSSNVGTDHSTMSLGMGVRFGALSEEQSAQLAALRRAAGDSANINAPSDGAPGE